MEEIRTKATSHREGLAHQAEEPNPRRVAKLERDLKLGRVLLGRPDTRATTGSGQEISTLVSLEQTPDSRFIVGIEMYLAGVDVGSLSDEQFAFATLDEAAAFVTRKTGVLFHKMYISA